jgi:hypothetical protein
MLVMKRRQFLQSLAAVGAVPLMPSLASGAMAVGNSSAAAPVVSAQAYKWAEVIVRAHKTSSLAMLQRHLRVDAAAANALQNQLIRNGVIGAQANAYGLYQATNPLFDGAFPKSDKIVQKAVKLVQQNVEVQETGETVEADADEPIIDDAVTEIPITALYNETDWTPQLVS